MARSRPTPDRAPQPDRRRRPPSPVGGSHELGQNLLLDKRFPASMADLLRHAPPRPVLELGAGNGAVTEALLTLRRPITAVEIDPRAAAHLRRRFGGAVEVVHADLLTVELHVPHDVVSNVPFGITTPLLRRLLAQDSWRTAVLLVQWEVARKRAGVGGTTLLTASWWPWYEFALDRRVPASAFTPVPAVDGGVLVIRRRDRPLVDPADRGAYQRLVRDVFTGPGRGLGAVLAARIPRVDVDRWIREHGIDARRLPRDLTALHWSDLYARAATDGARHRVDGRRPDGDGRRRRGGDGRPRPRSSPG